MLSSGSSKHCCVFLGTYCQQEIDTQMPGALLLLHTFCIVYTCSNQGVCIYVLLLCTVAIICLCMLIITFDLFWDLCCTSAIYVFYFQSSYTSHSAYAVFVWLYSFLWCVLLPSAIHLSMFSAFFPLQGEHHLHQTLHLSHTLQQCAWHLCSMTYHCLFSSDAACNHSFSW